MPCGGTLTIEIRNATFGVGDCADSLSAGDYVQISISDTGTGMSEEVRALAFEPFFTTKGPSEGSGLGLSMGHDVATQFGGGVRINSQPGSGTSIQVSLPRSHRGRFSGDGR
jgi:signal transduction histidine kinase